MIKIEELNGGSVAVSANLKGVKWVNSSIPPSAIEKQIDDDISSYFTTINKVLVSVEIEDIEDERSLSACSIFKLSMYLSFDGKIDYDDLETIENYLSLNFIKEF